MTICDICGKFRKISCLLLINEYSSWIGKLDSYYICTICKEKENLNENISI